MQPAKATETFVALVTEANHLAYAVHGLPKNYQSTNYKAQVSGPTRELVFALVGAAPTLKDVPPSTLIALAAARTMAEHLDTPKSSGA